MQNKRLKGTEYFRITLIVFELTTGKLSERRVSYCKLSEKPEGPNFYSGIF